MGKRYFVANTDNDKKCFSCPLKGMRCNYVKANGQQCGNRCLVTVPFCWVHTEELFGVRVRPINRYSGDQVGLFAKKDIQKNEAIIPYFGESVGVDEFHERYCDSTGPYAVSGHFENTTNVIDAACERSAASAANAPDRNNSLKANAKLSSVEAAGADKQLRVFKYLCNQSASFKAAADRNKNVTPKILPMELLLDERKNQKSSFIVLKSNERILAGKEIITSYGAGYWSKAKSNVTTKRYYKNEDKPRREHCDNPDGYNCDSDDYDDPEPLPDIDTPPPTPRAPSPASKKPTYEPRQMYYKGNKGHIVQPKTKEQKMLKQKFPDHVYFQIDETNKNGNLMVKKPQLLPTKDLSFEKKPSLPQIEEEQQEEPDDEPLPPPTPPRRNTRSNTDVDESHFIQYNNGKKWLPDGEFKNNNGEDLSVPQQVAMYRNKRKSATDGLQSEGTFSLDMTTNSVVDMIERLGGVEGEVVYEMGMAQGNIVAGMLAAGAEMVIGTEINPAAKTLVADVIHSCLPERYRDKVTFLIGEEYSVTNAEYWKNTILLNNDNNGGNLTNVVTAIIGPSVNDTLVRYLRELPIAAMVLLADSKEERNKINRWLHEGDEPLSPYDTQNYDMDHFSIKLAGSGRSKTLVILIKRESVVDDNSLIEEDDDNFDINMPDHLPPRQRRPVSPTVTKMLSGLHRNEERSQNEENKFVKRFKFLASKDESRKDKLDSLQKFADDRKDIFTVDQRLNINKKLRTFPIQLSGRNWSLSGSGPQVSGGGSIGLTLPSPEPNYGSRLTMSGRRNIK